MKVYIMLSILLLILYSSTASAVPPVTTQVISGGALTVSSNLPKAITQNITRKFEIHVINSTHNFNTGVSCLLHIYDEDEEGGHLYSNISSTMTDYDIEFKIPASVHLKKGLYSYKAVCNTSTQAGIYETEYYVTKSGIEPAEDTFTLFIYLLFILASGGLFYTFFIGLGKLVTASTTIYDVLISWSFYILTIIVYYVSTEYLIRSFIEDLTAKFLIITVWTNGVLPLIAFVISLFVRSMQKKAPLSVQEIAGGRLR